MQGIAHVTIVVALVSILAAFTLMSVVAVGNAMITVSFTTFRTDDSLVAADWDLCEGIEVANCG